MNETCDQCGMTLPHKPWEDGMPECLNRVVKQRDEATAKVGLLGRYGDFVHDLASRDHNRSCPANEQCTCIVGEAADVVMGIKR